MVDWVLPVARHDAPKLLEFVRNENRMQLPPEIPEADEPDAKVRDAPGGETVSDETRDPEDEEALLQGARRRARTYGPRFQPLQARDGAAPDRAADAGQLARFHPAISRIPSHAPAEARALLQDLLIGVTHFFRDRDRSRRWKRTSRSFSRARSRG